MIKTEGMQGNLRVSSAPFFSCGGGDSEPPTLLVLSGATRELLRQLIERSMRESFLVDAVERRWRSLRTGRAFHRWADPIRKARHQARMRWSSAIHKVTDMRKGDQKVVAVIAVREDGELPI